MPGLDQYLKGSVSTLEAEIYTKASMIAMSHSVEKVVKEYNLYADIYVLFQDYKFFLFERERYLELDKICRQIFIFAENIPAAAGRDFENTTFVELKEDSPLVDEWSLTVIHPDYSAVLATRENKNLQKIKKEDYRIFKGFLSLESEVAKKSAVYYHNLLENRGISYLDQDWKPEELNNKKPELQKLISLFINDSLFELEDKLRSLEEKEMRLDAMAADNKELSREIMQKLCEAAEFRDEDSLFHILRIGFTSALICRELGADKSSIENLFFASLLHDLGKIGIPDSILQKPGKLTAEEYEVMQNHPEIGAKILAGSHSEILNMAYNIAYSHHEKWDGSGYPQGLEAEEIPIEARIVALADVFDALSSKRVYKDAFPREKCVEIVSSERNQHFQSKIIDILLEHLDEIYEFRRDLEEFSQAKTTREISDYFFSVDFSIFEFLKMREMISS
ncbi:putative two-component system response regulator [Halanaerobium saccharolyticum]|uniref:Putative two-component system response regulator n=1 Tax=Halanaerobium saccharolyticum TaxID=43595 RepID=A0A4R7YMI3_9FIRM|nr:HD domain-containing phosphohydrolase [Halanaerobium saccharolyticum]RAK08513.1 putative two-component system response regulator [Halanaerobium saccharolyticum]TDV97925.1 putative two-component system response regulator [Halanaerobium saccharolyticum]TDX60005.1 putative two-component system response regulator [Halanaerobium saccharolyticum]